jgi:hypothetical protein
MKQVSWLIQLCEPLSHLTFNQRKSPLYIPLDLCVSTRETLLNGGLQAVNKVFKYFLTGRTYLHDLPITPIHTGPIMGL